MARAEFGRLRELLCLDEQMTYLLNKIENLEESTLSTIRFKIRNEVFEKLDRTDAVFGKLVARRIFDSFEALECKRVEKRDLYWEALRHSLVLFCQHSDWMQNPHDSRKRAFKMVDNLMGFTNRSQIFLQDVYDFLKGRREASGLEHLKTSDQRRYNHLFRLEDYMHFAGQLFYILVVPVPYFLKQSKEDVNGQAHIITERTLLEMINRHGPIYTSLLDTFFPHLRASHISEYVFLKMQTHMWALLYIWQLNTLRSNLTLANPLMKIKTDPTVHNKQQKTRLEKLQLPSRLTKKRQGIYFVNGFLSRDLNQYEYFKDFFCFFPYHDKHVIRWDADSMDMMEFSNDVVELLNGVYFLVMSITTGAMMAPQIIAKAIEIIRKVINKYNSTSQRAVDSALHAYQLILNRN